jgi:hypothetical protein
MAEKPGEGYCAPEARDQWLAGHKSGTFLHKGSRHPTYITPAYGVARTKKTFITGRNEHAGQIPSLHKAEAELELPVLDNLIACGGISDYEYQAIISYCIDRKLRERGRAPTIN